MHLDPLRSLPISTTRAIRADQDTLLRAVSALLPGSARQTPTPISLGEGSSVTLLHGFDRAGVAARDALTNMLHAAGVAVQPLAPEPALGEIHPSPRTSLVSAASEAVATAAERCACLWMAPVIAPDESYDRDTPLRLTMRPKPAMSAAFPAMAPDIVTRELRIDGSLGWSRRPGVPQRRSDGLLIEPITGGMVLTHNAHTRQPTIFRTQGPLVVTMRCITAGEVDGRPHLFQSGQALINQTTQPLYRIQTHAAPTSGEG